MALPRLLLLTDDAVPLARLRAEWPRVAAALPAGAVALSVRSRVLEAGELFKLVDGLSRHGPVLVSRRLDVARSVGAGGHLPARGVPTADARAYLGAGKLILRAAHDDDEVRAAEGADAVLLSPVWTPGSHAAVRPALGYGGLARACKATSLPVYALGGITPDTVTAARNAGAHGVAAVSAVWSAPDPAAAARALLQAFPFP